MKSISFVSVAAITMLAIVAASGACAEDAAKSDAYAQRMFAGKIGKPKSHACFARVYDAAHLAKHPKQKVRAMTLLVTAEKVPEDEKLNYSFSLGVAFRDRPGKFTSGGSCGHPVASEVSADKLQIGCGVDCDGGGLSIELANHDKSILARLDRIRIWRNDKPDDEEALSLEAGADDGVFRLDRVSLDQCRSLMANDKERSAMLQK
jgi:hypothetical protein